MKTSRAHLLFPALLLSLALAWSFSAQAINLSVTFTDAPGEGYFDPDLGAARQAAMQYALGIWAEEIPGDLLIQVEAQFNPLGGSPFGAVLASAGPNYFVDDPPGAPVLNTIYSGAQASFLAGFDLETGVVEITTQANSDVDNDTVLGEISWYYGTDANPPGNDVDFVTTTLHELGHGLGFLDLIDEFSGQFFFGNIPDIYSRQLTAPGLGNLDELSDFQRLNTLTSENLFWNGPSVVNEMGDIVKMYAPNPYQPGSSISHWDVSNSPDLLMEPFDTGPSHDVDLTRQAFVDIGWTIEGVEPPLTTPTPGPTPETSNRILIGAQSGTGKIVTFDGDTGVLINSFDPPEEAPLLSNSDDVGLAYGFFRRPTLFYCNADTSPGIIYLLDPTTGELIDSFNPTAREDLSENFDNLDPYVGLGYIRGDYQTDRGILIALTRFQTLRRIELLTGDERFSWNQLTESQYFNNFTPFVPALAGDDADLVLANGTFFFGGAPTGAWALNPATSATPDFVCSVPSSLVEGMAYDGDTIFLSDQAGRVFHVNPVNGAQRQAPTTIEGGAVYGLAVVGQPRMTPVPTTTVTRTPTATRTPTPPGGGGTPTATATPLGGSSFAVGPDPVSVSTGDMDGMNGDDIVTANKSTGKVAILYNNGSGGFGDLQEISLGGATNPSFVSVGDLNDDGLNDILVLAAGTNQVLTIENLGNRTYGLPTVFNIPVSRPLSAFIADLNQDNLYDLAIANSQTDTITVAINPGGTKGLLVDNTQVQTYPVGGEMPTSISGGVLRPLSLVIDLVTANFEDGTVSVLKNNGDGTFQTADLYVAGINPRGVHVADVNGDSANDIVVSNQGAPQLGADYLGDLVVLLNSGGGVFNTHPRITIEPGNHPIACAALDIDLDCDADLAVVNYGRPSPYSSTPEPGNLTFVLSTAFEEEDTKSNIFGSQNQMGFRALAIALGAFNGTRKDDIVVVNQQDGNVGVLLFSNENPPCSLPCDANMDGICDQLDFLAFAAAGAKVDPRIRDVGDINDDGSLDSRDILEFLSARRSPPAQGVNLLSAEGAKATGVTQETGSAGDLNGDGVIDYRDLN